MQQIIIPLVIVYHTAGLRLHGNPPLPLNVQFIQDLLIASRLNRASEFEQPVTERTLPMINMCHYTEIPESFDWYVFYTPLKLRDCPGSLSASCHRGGKGSGLGEEPGSILGSDRAR